MIGPIDKLPDDVLRTIWKFYHHVDDRSTLASVCLVCRRWYVTANPILYQKIEYFKGQRQQVFFRHLLSLYLHPKLSRHVQEIRLLGDLILDVKYMIPEIYGNIGEGGNGTGLPNPCLMSQVFERIEFPKLHTILIEARCPDFYPVIRQLCKSSRLESFQLVTGDLNEEFLNLSFTSRLRNIKLKEINPNRIFEYPMCAIEDLLCQQSRLQLNDSNSKCTSLDHFEYDGCGVNDSIMLKCLPYFQQLNLTSLHLCYNTRRGNMGVCVQVSDTSLIPLLENIPTLNKLHLSNVKISSDFFIHAGPYLTNLTHLSSDLPFNVLYDKSFDKEAKVKNMDTFLYSIFELLINFAPNLEELALGGSYVCPSFYKLDFVPFIPDRFFDKLLSSSDQSSMTTTAIKPGSRLKILQLQNIQTSISSLCKLSTRSRSIIDLAITIDHDEYDKLSLLVDNFACLETIRFFDFGPRSDLMIDLPSLRRRAFKAVDALYVAKYLHSRNVQHAAFGRYDLCTTESAQKLPSSGFKGGFTPFLCETSPHSIRERASIRI